MKIELTENTITDEHGNDTTTWLIDKGTGTIVINITKILNRDISYCGWVDKKIGLIEVFGERWDGHEIYCIINTNGHIIKDNLNEQPKLIEGTNLLIIETDEDCNDWYKAVINSDGDYLLEPEFEWIEYNEDEKVFITNPYYPFGTSEEVRFNLDGEKLDKNGEVIEND